MRNGRGEGKLALSHQVETLASVVEISEAPDMRRVTFKWVIGTADHAQLFAVKILQVSLMDTRRHCRVGRVGSIHAQDGDPSPLAR